MIYRSRCREERTPRRQDQDDDAATVSPEAALIFDEQPEPVAGKPPRLQRQPASQHL